MQDEYRHKGLRKRLVEQLADKGITDPKVLEAINRVPRHFFMDNAFLAFAYSDQAFPIGEQQTISQPYTVAFQTELLQIAKGQRVLEVGTGSGYQTCVLCELGAKVFSVERNKVLADRARLLLTKMEYSAKLFYRDGFQGLPSFAPFQRILVTCGAPVVPEKLLSQLAVGGRMVIPIGSGDTQEMTLIVKRAEDQFEQEQFGQFSFVPMLADRNSK